MAVARILRRSAATIIPLVIRPIGGQRYQHCSVLLPVVNCSNLSRQLTRSLFPSVHHYSSTSKRPSSDKSLVCVIETEIKCAEESDDYQGRSLGSGVRSSTMYPGFADMVAVT